MGGVLRRKLERKTNKSLMINDRSQNHKTDAVV